MMTKLALLLLVCTLEMKEGIQKSNCIHVGEYDNTRVQLLNQCGETLALAPVLADKVHIRDNLIYAVNYLDGVSVFEIACPPNHYGLNCDKRMQK